MLDGWVGVHLGGRTAGDRRPEPGHGSNGPDVLIESGIVRRDITASFGSCTGTADGVPTTVTLHLQDLAADCAGGAGMAAYLWHCDRDDNYSLYGEGVTDQNDLRGVQVAGADGTVSFHLDLPGLLFGALAAHPRRGLRVPRGRRRR